MSIKQELQSRILQPFSPAIFCDDGWLQLLEDLHNELIEVDSRYRIYQVKEKFGGLCFYYASSNPYHDAKLRKIVSKYEQKSFTVCEKTGEPGSLKTKDGWFKTLNDSFLEEGWTETPRNIGISKIMRNPMTEEA
jgi:hypothetical protein